MYWYIQQEACNKNYELYNLQFAIWIEQVHKYDVFNHSTHTHTHTHARTHARTHTGSLAKPLRVGVVSMTQFHAGIYSMHAAWSLPYELSGLHYTEYNQAVYSLALTVSRSKLTLENTVMGYAADMQREVCYMNYAVYIIWSTIKMCTHLHRLYFVPNRP